MRRLLFIATGAFFVLATLLPTQPPFVVRAVSDGERLAMYSKPAVVRIIDGAAGKIWFQPPGYQGQSFDLSVIALGSGFFISKDGYIATNAHVVSTTHDGEEKAKQALFWQLVNQLAKQVGKDPRSIVADTHATYFGAELDDQSLTPGANPRLGPTRFDDWLSQSVSQR